MVLDDIRGLVRLNVLLSRTKAIVILIAVSLFLSIISITLSSVTLSKLCELNEQTNEQIRTERELETAQLRYITPDYNF